LGGLYTPQSSCQSREYLDSAWPGPCLHYSIMIEHAGPEHHSHIAYSPGTTNQLAPASVYDLG